MCGIAGKVNADGQPVEDALLGRMCAAIAHRGPDDEGHWTGEGGVGLAMRRLQVIDLEGGAQPMSNEDGSLWIVFNGEIYNYGELRSELEAKGHQFRSQSDTESILHLFEEEGDACFGRLRGMFALALWDVRRRRLVVARDRLGKKPFYYAQPSGQGFSFASELTALLEDTDIERQLDEKAIDEYLSYLFVPHPRTPYRGVFKLPPAAVGVWESGQFAVSRYWEADGIRSNGHAPANPSSAVDELDDLLRDAVRCRLQADVPLGAFLSGGLDSSLIVAIMAQLAPDRVKTFSIGFAEESFNETVHARHVAEVLGTDHREYEVGWNVEELLPRLLDHFGEPFADSSAIPTYYLSQQTRQEVTVSLSGDGGDEIFGGYRRYQARCWTELYNRWPAWGGRGAVESVLAHLPEPEGYYGDSLIKRAKRFSEFAASVREAPQTSWAFFLRAADKRHLFTDEFQQRLSADTSPGSFDHSQPRAGEGVSGMLRFDRVSYLPDDILVKVDRMSMACSLEVRCPLLDHHVVEFADRLPLSAKVGLRHTKKILRQVATRYLPKHILERPKHGFAVPLAEWLRGPLQPMLHQHLLEPGSAVHGIARPEAMQQMAQQHDSGARDWSQQLWALIVLELWLRRSGMSL